MQLDNLVPILDFRSHIPVPKGHSTFELYSCIILLIQTMMAGHSHAHSPGEEAGCSCALHSSGVSQSMQVCLSMP